MAIIRILSYFILVFSICEANNCDTQACNSSKQNTLCKFQDPARHCIDYERTINTTKEKQAILDKLNSRRNKVAAGDIRSLPSADNMMKLEWNEELENSAQRWANQCVKHNTPDFKDVCRDLGSVYVGQNIATIYGEAPGLTPLALVDVWYMELLNFNASILPHYKSSKDAKLSHYDYFTQLVWATSYQVGCGGVKFKERLQDGSNEKTRMVYRLVCNFAPGGNIVNQTVYKEGPPCSNCPEETCDAIYTALCGSESSKNVLSNQDKMKIELHKTKSKHSKKTKEHDTVTNTEETYSILNLDKENKEDGDSLTLDFFTHAQDFVRPTLATTMKSTSCKDLEVDDFVELLKKKLGTDPMFRDLLHNSVETTESIETGFTDALELIGKIYSKKASTAVTKTQVKQFVNSTHLVDLIEAIIFRSADTVKGTSEKLTTVPLDFEVNPVMVQAELAQVKRNPDFTGHLFFPEDINEDNIESTEQYYDVTPHAQAEFPMDELRITKATKDFLDEILESETMSEKQNENNLVMKKRSLRKRKNLGSDYFGDEGNLLHALSAGINKHKVPKNFKKFMQNLPCGTYLVKYTDLLHKLASDLKVLKLNEKYHCARSGSQKYVFSTTSLIYCLLLCSYILYRR